MRPLAILLLFATTTLAGSSAFGTVKNAQAAGITADIGGGFSFIQYLRGRCNYRLNFSVPAKDIHIGDAIVAPEGFQLTFQSMDPIKPYGPEIGYSSLSMKSRDGKPITVFVMRLECDDRVSLESHLDYSDIESPGTKDDAPFFNSRSEIPSCLAAIDRAGQFRLTFTPAGSRNVAMVVSGHIQLRQALEKAHFIIQAEVAKLNHSTCAPTPF